MLVNMRGRMPGVAVDMAGNFERPMFCPARTDPVFWRQVQKHWEHFGKEGNPKLTSPNVKEQLVACNLSCVTNWASLTHFIQPAGVKLLGHCCAKSFVKGLPGFDMTVVFKGDAEGT